jgi:hypothetical protein
VIDAPKRIFMNGFPQEFACGGVAASQLFRIAGEARAGEAGAPSIRNEKKAEQADFRGQGISLRMIMRETGTPPCGVAVDRARVDARVADMGERTFRDRSGR